MSRLDHAFAQMRAGNRPGLVTYVTAGDPDLARSREVVRALDRAGADVIEIGVPFSDPVADGPAIQRASERARLAGGTLASALDLVADVRKDVRAPFVLFTYVNPVLAFGFDRFVARAADAGVSGVLLLDLPIEESHDAHARLSKAGLDQIFLVSPTTTDARLRQAATLGRGFLYAISRLGVTGARASVSTSAQPLVERVRRATGLPVALGFGISTHAHVKEVCAFADAAVVGSALVERIERTAAGGGDVAAEVETFVRALKGHGE